MTKTILYTVTLIFTLILAGCSNHVGGTHTDEYDGTDTGGSENTGSMSGDGDIVNTGGINGDGDESTGGTNTGGIDNGGSGSSGGAGGSVTCVPETCDQIGERLSGIQGHSACGIVINNCGAEIDCSNTTCDRYQDCGSPIWDMNSPGEITGEEWYVQAGVSDAIYDSFINEIYPNICGEGCVDISEVAPSLCPNDYPVALLCDNDVVPDNNCIESASSPFCCSSSGRYQPYN
jgi:hypothetical protein